MNLTALPDAYWANVPWWARLSFMAIAMVVSVVIGPWCVQWARGRPSAMVSRERAVADQEAVVREAREAALRDARDGEAAARAALAKERTRWIAERQALEADRDGNWELGRGMEDIAHNYLHQYRGLAQRFGALMTLVRGIISGSMMSERAKALVDEVPPVADLPDVPKLRDVVKKKP